MNEKQRLNAALVRLCEAADYDFDPPADSQGGPFAHLKRALLDLDFELVADTFPQFRDTWLFNLACQVQEVPIAGQVIVAGVLPPAPLLAQAAKNDADKPVLLAGATVSIRPPGNDLLILSPATATAAVYTTTAQGLTRLGDSVVDFVEREIAAALGAPAATTSRAAEAGSSLPVFGLDQGGRNFALVVAGRRVAAPETQAQVHALRKVVDAAGQRLGLPLAYVHMGTAINWTPGDEGSYEPADAIIGVVTQWIDGDGGEAEPVELSGEALAPAALERVPEDFWAELEEEHGAALGEAGLFLAPAGWTVASIYAAEDATWEGGSVKGEALVTTCSEDTEPGVLLGTHEALQASKGKLLLYATYA